MSPIDDELRAALHGRAQVLTPSTDPLAGIERRARRMRRNRAGAAVAGSALAVAMIAVAVPAVQDAVAPRQDVPNMAASNPPVADLDPSLYALDPQDPWDFRGIPVSDQDRALIQQEYATRTGGSQVRITPLYAGKHDGTERTEAVFLADVDGESRWGIAAYPTEAGLEIVWDEPLPEPALALAAALPGEEAPRLVLVTTPEAVRIFYGTDGSDAGSISSTERGVAVATLDRDVATDYYGVLVDGDELVRAPAPDPRDITQEESVDAPEAAVVPQGYAFDPAEPWDFRGQGDPVALVEEADRLFAQTYGRGWTGRALYAADSDAGVRVLLRLHTKAGAPALVTTTWQVGDRPAQQDDQVVDAGQALIQASVPTDSAGGSRLLVALASPRAGGIVLTGPGGNRPDGIGDPGAGLWVVEAGEQAVVRLYTEGDGVEYLAEPARTS